MKEERPIIISASRRTDIPAFYMDDFLKVWNRGWTIWKNPFNPNQRKIVRFEDVKLVVFWSKYPVGILRRFEDLSFDYYVLFTVNDYPEFEPNLPPLDIRLELFEKLSEKLGKYRVVWRFDPIILARRISEPEDVLEKFSRILDRLYDKTFRVIVSFLTPYRKTVSRLRRAGYELILPDKELAVDMAKEMAKMAKSRGLEIQSCADRFNADGSLERVGIRRGACIDPDLVSKSFPEDISKAVRDLGRDRGQRRECLCLKSVDIGEYGTCKFRCLYCYAV